MARLAGYRPERYLAEIAYAPSQYEPSGMDTVELSNQTMSSPQLIISNGGDNINGAERPYGYFKKYYERGAPCTFAVQNRTPHRVLFLNVRFNQYTMPPNIFKALVSGQGKAILLRLTSLTSCFATP